MLPADFDTFTLDLPAPTVKAIREFAQAKGLEPRIAAGVLIENGLNFEKALERTQASFPPGYSGNNVLFITDENVTFPHNAAALRVGRPYFARLAQGVAANFALK